MLNGACLAMFIFPKNSKKIYLVFVHDVCKNRSQHWKSGRQCRFKSSKIGLIDMIWSEMNIVNDLTNAFWRNSPSTRQNACADVLQNANKTQKSIFHEHENQKNRNWCIWSRPSLLQIKYFVWNRSHRGSPARNAFCTSYAKYVKTTYAQHTGAT